MCAVIYVCACVAIQSIGLLTVNAEYEEVLQKKTRSDKPMFLTAWKLEELKKLCVECRSLHAEINVTMDLVHDPDTNFEQSNIPRWLTNLRGRLSAVLKAVYKYKRHHANTSATATPTPKPGEVFGGVKEAITAP